MVQQKRELSLGRGGKDIQAPPQVPGTRATLPGIETLPFDSKDSGYSGGAWPAGQVIFQDVQAGCRSFSSERQ